MQILAQKPLCFEVENEFIRENRFSVEFYHPHYLVILEKINKSKYLKSFEDILTLLTDMGAFSLYNVQHFVPRGVPFIRVNNVKEDAISLTDLKFISTEYHNELKKSQLKPGDVLLTTKGTIGVSAVVPKDLGDANISQNLVRMQFNDKVLPQYVSVFLNSTIGRIQTERLATGVNQKYLNFENIRSIKIIVPPKSIQAMVVEVAEDSRKKQDENLASIEKIIKELDDFFLKELGLFYPKEIKVRSFAIKLEERLDVEYYRPKYVENMRILSSGKFELGSLASLTEVILRGIEPGSKEYSKEETILFLRVQNLEKGRIVVDSNSVFLSQEVYDQHKGLQPRKLDILFSKDGSIGISSVYEVSPKKCIIASGIAIIRAKENVNPYYLSYILNSKFVKLQTLRESYGSIIKHLSMRALQRILIPLPDIQTQERLARKIKEVDGEIKRLHAETSDVRQKAKARIEKMILEN